MTTTSSTYIPRDIHQPRGKQPWCGVCDTDIHLSVESPAVTDRQTGILAVALHCSNCRQSRVFDTTAEHVAAFPPLVEPHRNLIHHQGAYFHCGVVMTPPGPRAESTVATFPGQPGLRDSPVAYLATKVLRCRCGFQMELPG
jgi:hypothetical protein